MYCHHCQWEFSVPESSLGTVVECPHCAAHITVENRTMVLPCPECKTSLQVELWMIGELAECPSCHKEIKLHCVSSPPETNIEIKENYKPIPGASCKKGEILGKYQICRCLGVGGMGEVYLARHTVMETFCALKLLKPEVAVRNRALPERLIREAKIAAQLQHPNIITVFDACIDRENNRSYIVMEYVDGVTVEEMLKNGPLPEEQVLEIAKHVTSALVAASRIGIVHRDIKPANIMVTKQGMIKLADLGIAKGDANTVGVTLTQDNAVLGTPNYASPEQLRSSHHVDARADVYSLGATMYHMLTGIMPFAGDTVFNVMAKVLEETLPPLESCGRNISPMTRDLVERMLAKDPKDRPPNAVELLQELRAIDPNNITVSGKLKKLRKRTKKNDPPADKSVSGVKKKITQIYNLFTAVLLLILLVLGIKIFYNVYQEKQKEDAEKLFIHPSKLLNIVSSNDIDKIIDFAENYNRLSRKKVYHWLAREAITTQNVSILKQMLQRKLIPAASEVSDVDFIYYIKQSGNAEILELFLDHGLPVYHRNGAGATVLMQVAENPQMVKAVLKHKDCNVNNRDRNGKTALFYTGGNPYSTQYLLDAGADVNAVDNLGQNALFTHTNSIDHIKILCDAKIDLEHKNKEGLTALEAACRLFNSDTAFALIKAGAKVSPAIKNSIYQRRHINNWYKVWELVSQNGEPQELSSNQIKKTTPQVIKVIQLNTNKNSEELSNLSQQANKVQAENQLQSQSPQSRTLDERLKYAEKQLDLVPEQLRQAMTIKSRKQRENRQNFLHKRQSYLRRQVNELRALAKMRRDWEKEKKPQYDRAANESFQKQMLNYTSQKRGYGYSSQDYKDAVELAKYFQGSNVDPDIEVTDGSYAKNNGPLVKLLASGRIPAVEHFIPTWLKRHPRLDSSILFNISANQSLNMLLDYPFDNIDVQPTHNYYGSLLVRQFYYSQPNTEILQKLLLRGANADFVNSRGYTALHLAVFKKPELVQDLLIAGADPNIPDREGRTPAFYAVITGNFSIIQPLLAAGADDKLKDKYGKKAVDYKNQGLFSIAVQKEQYGKIRELIRKGIDVNGMVYAGETALQYACRKNDRKLALLLLEAQADVNARKDIGGFRSDTPLQLACLKMPESLSLFQLLVQHGANTALPPPGYGGCTILSQLLSPHGYYPFRNLPEKNRQQVIYTLISKFSQLNAEQQKQCFRYALNAESEKYLPRLRMARHGWVASDVDFDNAIRNNCSQETLELLKHDLEPTNRNLQTAISSRASVQTVRWLLDNGAVPTQTTVNMASDKEIKNMLQKRLER